MAVAFLLERVQALGPVVAPLQLLEPGLLLGQVPADLRQRLFAQQPLPLPLDGMLLLPARIERLGGPGHGLIHLLLLSSSPLLVLLHVCAGLLQLTALSLFLLQMQQLLP